MSEFTVFNNKILDWAIDRSGLSIDRLGFPVEKVKMWLDGDKKPTIIQTRALAKKLDVPFGYFCLFEPPTEGFKLPDFRTKGNHPINRMSLGLRKSLRHARYCQSFLRDFLRDDDYPIFQYKNSLNLNMTPQEAAQMLRKILGTIKISGDPSKYFSSLVNRIEEIGIFVQKNSCALTNTKDQLDIQEFRGFALCDDYAPLIFINSNDSLNASCFTLIHELCHILLDETGLSGMNMSSNLVERFCDSATVEYLVPKEEFVPFWRDLAENFEDEDSIIAASAKRFGLSKWVTLRRAGELGLIPSYVYEIKLKALLNTPKKKRKDGGGPNFNVLQTARLGSRFVNTVVVAAFSGSVTFAEAMNLTLLSQDALKQKVKELRL